LCQTPGGAVAPARAGRCAPSVSAQDGTGDDGAAQDDGALRIVEENLDECVLCDLCVRAAPAGAVKIVKLYE